MHPSDSEQVNTSKINKSEQIPCLKVNNYRFGYQGEKTKANTLQPNFPTGYKGF